MADWASKAPDYNDNNKYKRKSSKDSKKQQPQAKKKSSWNRSWKPAPTDIQGAVFGILPDNTPQQHDIPTNKPHSSATTATAVHHTKPELIGLEEENDEILQSVFGPSEQLVVKPKHVFSQEQPTVDHTRGRSNSGNSSSSSSANSLPDEETAVVDTNDVPQLLAYAEGGLISQPTKHSSSHKVDDINCTNASDTDSSSSESSSSENESEDNEEAENIIGSKTSDAAPIIIIENNISVNVTPTKTPSEDTPTQGTVVTEEDNTKSAPEVLPTEEELSPIIEGGMKTAEELKPNTDDKEVPSQTSLPEAPKPLIVHAEVPLSDQEQPQVINDNADNNISVESAPVVVMETPNTSEQVNDQSQESIQPLPLNQDSSSSKEYIQDTTVYPTSQELVAAVDDFITTVSPSNNETTSTTSIPTVNDMPQSNNNGTDTYTKTKITTTELTLSINEVKTTTTKMTLTYTPIKGSNDSTQHQSHARSHDTSDGEQPKPTVTSTSPPIIEPTIVSPDVQKETLLESSPDSANSSSKITTDKQELSPPTKLPPNDPINTLKSEVVTETPAHSTDTKGNTPKIDPTTPPDITVDDSVPLLSNAAQDIAIEIEDEPPLIEPWMMTTYLGIFDDFNDQKDGNKPDENREDPLRPRVGWKRNVEPVKVGLLQCFRFCNRSYDFNTRKLEDTVDYNVAPIARKPITLINAYRQQATENDPLKEDTPLTESEEVKVDEPQITNDSSDKETKIMFAQSTSDPTGAETRPKPKFSESIGSVFSFFDRLGGARSVGVKAIQTSLSNIYTNTPFGNIARHIAVYGGFLLTLIFFILAIVSFSETQKTKVCTMVPNSSLCKPKGSNVLGIFEILFGLIGLLFTSYDTFVHTKNTFQKCSTCERIQGVSGKVHYKTWNHSKVKSAHKAVSMAYHCSCCPKKIVTIMDIVRVFVMDGMFYPALILSIFSVCTEIAHEGKGSASSWLLAVVGFLGDFLTVYIVRLFILLGSIYSITRVRKINKAYSYKDMFKGAFFQVTFVVYSMGVMILQIMIIVFLGNVYYEQYNAACAENVPSSNITAIKASLNKNNLTDHEQCHHSNLTVFDVNYSPSFQFVYLFCYGYFLPMIATMMFFTVHKFWTDKLPLEFIADIIGTFSNSSFDISNMLTKSDRDEYAQDFKKNTENIMKFLVGSKFNDEIEKMKSTSLFDQLIYPFSSPLPVILCIINVTLTIMSYAFMIQFYSEDTQMVVALIIIIFFSFLAMAINAYSLIVVVFWLLLLYCTIYGLMFTILIVLAIWFFYCCITSSSRRHHRYHRY